MFLQVKNCFKRYKIFFFILFIFPLSAVANPSILQLKINDLPAQFQQAPLNGRFNESSCTEIGNSNKICVAVGFTKNNEKLYPLMVNSTNGGKTFQVINIFSNHPTTGTLLTTSCTSTEMGDHFCIAGGYLGDNKETGTPLLLQSIDGGNKWVQAIVPGLPKFGLFKKLSCTGRTHAAGSRATCIAVGWGKQNPSSDMHPILVQGTDNGQKWVNKSISNLPATIKGQLYSVSCTGYDNYAMCVAIGNYFSSTSTIPMVIQTTDGGNTWFNKPNSDFNMKLTFADVNCNGGNDSTICTLVGRIDMDNSLGQPVIYQTKDRGTNWTKNSLENFPSNWNGTVNSISCAGDCANAFCSTVTGNLKPTIKLTQSNTLPMVYVWQNNVYNKWLKASIYNASANWNTLYSTTCVNGTNDFCFAAGFAADHSLEKPILAVSSKNLSVWNAVQINNLPSQGILRNTACTKSGSTCIAVGYSEGLQDEPLLVASLDGGNSWTTKSIASIANAYFACDPKSPRCVAVKYWGMYQYEAYYSQDGGKNWITSRTNKNKSGSYWGFSDLACGTDIKNCVAVGSDGNHMRTAVALRTIDGGVSWQDTYFKGPCSDLPGDEGIAFFNSVTCDESGLNCMAKGQCSMTYPKNEWIYFTVAV